MVVVLPLLAPADLAMISRAGPELRAQLVASGPPRAGHDAPLRCEWAPGVLQWAREHRCLWTGGTLCVGRLGCAPGGAALGTGARLPVG